MLKNTAEGSSLLRRSRYNKFRSSLLSCQGTVDSALTQALRWTLKVMGFHGVWVPKEGLRLNGQIGGHQKPWGITGYGFPRRWVKAESTVVLIEAPSVRRGGAWPEEAFDFFFSMSSLTSS